MKTLVKILTPTFLVSSLLLFTFWPRSQVSSPIEGAIFPRNPYSLLDYVASDSVYTGGLNVFLDTSESEVYSIDGVGPIEPIPPVGGSEIVEPAFLGDKRNRVYVVDGVGPIEPIPPVGGSE